MMSIHISHEKIEHSHVHNVEQSPTFVVRDDFFDEFTIFVIVFPIGFFPFMIGSTPRMAPGFSWCYGLCGTYAMLRIK